MVRDGCREKVPITGVVLLVQKHKCVDLHGIFWKQQNHRSMEGGGEDQWAEVERLYAVLNTIRKYLKFILRFMG